MSRRMGRGDPGDPGEWVGDSSEHLVSDREAWVRGDLPLSMDGGTNGERHEFHLLLNQTAYCICGWAVSRPSPIGHLTKEEARAAAETINDVAWFGERYREHLD